MKRYMAKYFKHPCFNIIITVALYSITASKTIYIGSYKVLNKDEYCEFLERTSKILRRGDKIRISGNLNRVEYSVIYLDIVKSAEKYSKSNSKILKKNN